MNDTTAVQERNPGNIFPVMQPAGAEQGHIATTNFPIKEATAVTDVGNLEPPLTGNNKKKSPQVATIEETEKQESNMIQIVKESDGETSFERFLRAKSFFGSDVTDGDIKCRVKEKPKLSDDLEYIKTPLRYSNDKKTQKYDNDDEVLPDNKSKSCGHFNKQNPRQVDTVKIKPRRLTLDSVFGAAWKAMKPSDRATERAKPTCQFVGEIQQVNQQSGEILVMKLINMLSVDDKELKEKNCVEALPILTDLLKIVKRY